MWRAGSGPLDPEPGDYVRAGLLGGSADLLQQARQVEVVMRLPDALPFNLEHLRGFQADPATGRGDVARWHVERPGLGALPGDFERDGAVIGHRPVNPPPGVRECFLPPPVGLQDRFLAFETAVGSQLVVYALVSKRGCQAVPVAGVERVDICASYISRSHSYSPCSVVVAVGHSPANEDRLQRRNPGCAWVELMKLSGLTPAMWGGAQIGARCAAWLADPAAGGVRRTPTIRHYSDWTRLQVGLCIRRRTASSDPRKPPPRRRR